MLSFISSVTTLLALLACLFAFPSLAGFVVRLAFRWIGFFVQRKSKGKREALRSRVQSEAASFSSRQTAAEDEDWEKVEGYNSESSSGKGTPQSDWEGVVGFFHPFW